MASVKAEGDLSNGELAVQLQRKLNQPWQSGCWHFNQPLPPPSPTKKKVQSPQDQKWVRFNRVTQVCLTYFLIKKHFNVAVCLFVSSVCSPSGRWPATCWWPSTSSTPCRWTTCGSSAAPSCTRAAIRWPSSSTTGGMATTAWGSWACATSQVRGRR